VELEEIRSQSKQQKQKIRIQKALHFLKVLLQIAIEEQVKVETPKRGPLTSSRVLIP